MAEERNALVEGTSERELMETRILNAPRELVWKVWTEPEHIAQWWGPNSFTTTIHTMDVKPGKTWEFIMHGPDGRNYDNKILYVEVVKPELLVYDHTSTPFFRATITLEDLNGKTKLTMRMVFESIESRNQTIKVFKADEGLKQTLGRLMEHLQQLQ
jgi:uncharacterized protein YndB with AHSA1/START domain